MGAFVRSIFAVLTGLLVAMVLLLVVQYASDLLFPVDPAIVLTGSTSQVPLGAMILVLAGWAAGSFVGAWLSGRMAGRAPMVHGMLVALLLLTAGVTTLAALPHPLWMWVAGILVFIVLGYAGSRAAGGNNIPSEAGERA
jgi:hypothetical protein